MRSRAGSVPSSDLLAARRLVSPTWGPTKLTHYRRLIVGRVSGKLVATENRS